MTGGDAALSATVSALLFESFEEADLAKMSDTEPPDFFSGEGLPWGGGGGGGDSSSAAADVRQDNPEGLAWWPVDVVLGLETMKAEQEDQKRRKKQKPVFNCLVQGDQKSCLGSE